MRKLVVTFALLALAPFTLAACGGDDSSDTSSTSAETSTSEDTGGGTADAGGGGTVSVTAAADGSFAFDETELTAKAGPTTIEFDNPASLGHDVCLEQDGSEVGCSDIVTDDSTTLDADLESGEYTYYCSVPGHRDGGMEGTLTVD